MKLHYRDPKIRPHLFEGNFGLEKESLRVLRSDAQFARTRHPFSSPNIVQDFAENQTEINTDVWPDWKGALNQCRQLTIEMLNTLQDQNETLWPFSNPPAFASESSIPMMQSGSDQAIEYREYLSERYGRRKMTYSGIHYNFSFPVSLLRSEYQLDSQKQLSFQEFQNRFYLDLTQKIVWYGWIIDALLNASPVYDGSLFDDHEAGKPRFSGMSSMRNSELGFWNFFVPQFDYRDMKSYTDSICRYVHEGLLKAPRELYYPVRIKPSSAYSLEALNEQGATHIELRMVDLNPYEFAGISEMDAQFCHLFLVFLACMDDIELSVKDQVYAIQNFKNASRFSLEQTRILFDIDTSSDARTEAHSFLDDMSAFFSGLHEYEALECIACQKKKLENPRYSLAARVRNDFSDFTNDGLKQALKLQNKAIEQSSPVTQNCLDQVEERGIHSRHENASRSEQKGSNYAEENHTRK